MFISLRGIFYYNLSCYIANLSHKNYVYVLLLGSANYIELGNVIAAWIMFTGMSDS